MQVAEIELYKILKTRFSETEAESIVASLDQKILANFENRKNEFATKEDVMKLENKLEVKIAETRADLIKWMFIFWIGSIGVLSGIMITLFNVYSIGIGV